MRFVYFTHSLASCWNHGNAHFLRGVLRELIHAAAMTSRPSSPPAAGAARTCSRITDAAGLAAYARAYPELSGRRYDDDIDVAAALVGSRRGDRARMERAMARRRHRPGAAARRPLHAAVPRHPSPRRQRSGGDPRLRPRRLSTACSPSARRSREVYRRWGWGDRVFTWHEAADTRLFQPPGRRDPARRPGLDRQLGRRASAAPSSRAFSCGRRGPSACRSTSTACAIPTHALRRAAPARRSLSRLAAEYQGARDLRAPSRDRARAAAVLRRRCCPASRPSACSRRWPAASRWSRRLGDDARTCSGRARTYLVAARRGRDGAPPRGAARRPGAARRARRERPRDHPRAAHLRPPRRRAAGDRASASAPPSRAEMFA